MIERFLLPHRLNSEAWIDLACGKALDVPHDFVQGVKLFAIKIYEGRENEMRVIRHDYEYVQVVFRSVSI